MGGRGGRGGGALGSGGRSAIDEDFQSRGKGGADNLGAGSSGGGGGGGGSKSYNSGGAGTGGIQTGGGSGSGGGGSVTEVKQPDAPTTDINEQTLPPDADLKDLFEQSDIFDELLDKNLSDAAYKSQYDRYYSRWLQSEGLALEIDFSGVDESVMRDVKSNFEKMPIDIRVVLKDRDLRVNVGPTASDTDRWNDYSLETGLDSGDLVADGREYESVNFYDFETNDIFISTDNPGSSYNVIVHEMGHAVDATWLKEPVEVDWDADYGDGLTYSVWEISRDDPDWIYMHNNFILNNEGVDLYYRGGPSGVDDADGRSELFAEGMAAYFQGGRESLEDFLQEVPEDLGVRTYVVETMIAVWTRYGII